ncbi:hypothetical protein [Blastomonas sp.]|uniref:hypothetical protein n=1 Tax=Blastomonas sp. TaxID=1909299 RepID=UPI002619A6F8|nr:hypothetical protein [Blastomonas sp.]MDM7957761.1 hypothetical protein [Blastomonas sp.]
MRQKTAPTATLKQAHHPEFNAWVNALHRCHNPAHYSFPDYGGRGISVCDEWRRAETGFETFLDDMGPRPSPDHSIERLDNDAGYEPNNCIWADRKVQSNNRRKQRDYQMEFGLGFGPRKSPIIEYQGRIQTMHKWAMEIGLKGSTLRQRLRRGMTVEQAFTATTEELKKPRRLNVLKQITIR